MELQINDIFFIREITPTQAFELLLFKMVNRYLRAMNKNNSAYCYYIKRQEVADKVI